MIKDYVATCVICQRNKVELSYPAGLLQPLNVRHQIWVDISWKNSVLRRGRSLLQISSFHSNGSSILYYLNCSFLFYKGYQKQLCMTESHIYR